MARNSYHIAENPMYKKASAYTQIKYIDNNDTINAFARKSQYGMGYEVCMMAGICNSFRAVATGIVTKSPDKILQTFKAYGAFVQDNNGKFPEKKLFNFLDVLGVDVLDKTLATEVHRMTLSMIFSVISHELGHVNLGHCDKESIHDLVTIRNDERMADLFAASLAESVSAFKMDFVPATLFTEIMLLWAHTGDNNRPEDDDPTNPRPLTHPVSVERISNFLNANSETLKEYGITKENIVFLLPQVQ
jgi:hypothetical protein